MELNRKPPPFGALDFVRHTTCAGESDGFGAAERPFDGAVLTLALLRLPVSASDPEPHPADLSGVRR